jgi:general secretion pathway protein E
MSSAVQDCLLTEGTERAIESAAATEGMAGMFADGLSKILAGETTLDEVLRVTRVAA